MQQRYVEDVDPGDEFAEPWTATREQVEAFIRANVNLGGDDRFLDQQAAEAVGMRRPIVPGPMSLAVLTRVVTDWMGPDGLLRTLDANFRRPVEHGDRLRALALVTDVEESAGLVKLDVYLENERGERPLQGVAVVELPRREE